MKKFTIGMTILAILFCILLAFQTYENSSYKAFIEDSFVNKAEHNLSRVFRYSDHLDEFSNLNTKGFEHVENASLRIKELSNELEDQANLIENSPFYNGNIDLDDMGTKLDAIARTVERFSEYPEGKVPQSLLDNMKEQSLYLSNVADEISVENLSLGNIGETLKKLEDEFREPADWQYNKHETNLN